MESARAASRVRFQTMPKAMRNWIEREERVGERPGGGTTFEAFQVIEWATQPGLPAARPLSMPLNPFDPAGEHERLELQHGIQKPDRCQDELERPLEVPRLLNRAAREPPGIDYRRWRLAGPHLGHAHRSPPLGRNPLLRSVVITTTRSSDATDFGTVLRERTNTADRVEWGVESTGRPSQTLLLASAVPRQPGSRSRPPASGRDMRRIMAE